MDSLERVQQKATRWVTSTYDSVKSDKRTTTGNIAEGSQNSTSDIYVQDSQWSGQVAVPAKLIDLELSVRTSRGDYNQQKRVQVTIPTRTIPTSTIPTRTVPTDAKLAITQQ